MGLKFPPRKAHESLRAGRLRGASLFRQPGGIQIPPGMGTLEVVEGVSDNGGHS